MQRILVAIVWLLLAPGVLAQIGYNAGNAGNPPTAPSPTTQGWTETLNGSGSVAGVSPDPNAPINAWQVTDTGLGMVRYYQAYYPPKWYQAEVVMQLLSGDAYLEVDAGENIMDNVFKLALRRVGQDVHVIELVSGTTVVCPGGGIGYHTFAIQSSYAANDGYVIFDGGQVGMVPYSAWGLGGTIFGSGMLWGTRPGIAGEARIHRAWFGADAPCSFKTAVYCTAKVNSQGCTPAITWTGSPSASHATTFRIWGNNVINKSFGLLIYSKAGPDAKPFQGGTLCLQTPILRTKLQNSGGNPPPADCSGVFVFEFNDHIASGIDPGLTLGQKVWTQYWYRDAASPTGTGLTDALSFTICQ